MVGVDLDVAYPHAMSDVTRETLYQQIWAEPMTTVAKQYGELPNSAIVIARGGKVALKLAWAAVHDVERELARLAGEPPPAEQPADLQLIARQLGGERPVLVEPMNQIHSTRAHSWP